MNINEELYDLAERFLMGDVSDQERETIETLLKSSPEFQLYVSQIQKANEVLFLEGLNMDHQTISKAENKYFFRLQLFRLGKWMGGIALVLLLSYLFINRSEPVEIINTPLSTERDTSNEVTKGNNRIVEVSQQKTSDNLSQNSAQLSGDSSEKPILNHIHAVGKSKDSATVKTNPNPNDPPLTKEDPCKNKIKFLVQTISSCEDKSDGGIRVSSISGGSAPYKVRLNQGKYSEYPAFNFLAPDVYSVSVRDANGCTTEESVEVPSKKCLSENMHVVFSYQKGEDWKLPETLLEEVEFQLFTSSGKVVYSAVVYNNTPTYWNGLSATGQRLTLGLYPYKLFNRSTNELIGQGTITVVD